MRGDSGVIFRLVEIEAGLLAGPKIEFDSRCPRSRRASKARNIFSREHACAPAEVHSSCRTGASLRARMAPRSRSSRRQQARDDFPPAAPWPGSAFASPARRGNGLRSSRAIDPIPTRRDDRRTASRNPRGDAISRAPGRAGRRAVFHRARSFSGHSGGRRFASGCCKSRCPGIVLGRVKFDGPAILGRSFDPRNLAGEDPRMTGEDAMPDAGIQMEPGRLRHSSRLPRRNKKATLKAPSS